MPIKTIVQSCCGTSTTILELSKPIRKQHVSLIEGGGWTVSEQHLKSGLLYFFNNQIYCSGHLGSNQLKITQRGEQSLDSLEKLLEEAVVK